MSHSGNRLDAVVTEGAQPDGDPTPMITVTEPARVRDLATVPNSARTGAFAATQDSVRPTLLDAHYGEANAGACGIGPQDGRIDCFRAEWSEPVEQPTSAGVFSSSLGAPVSVMSTVVDDSSDIAVSPAAGANRDLGGSVGYAGGGGVEDVQGNLGLPAGPIGTTAACIDNTNEQNDVQEPESPSMNELTYTTEQVMCAFDPDWFRVIAQDGNLHVRVDPSESLRVTVRLWDGGTQIEEIIGPGPGVVVDLVSSGLVLDGVYWVQITADAAQEGPYCADPLPLPGENCQDGDDTPQ